MHVCGQKDTVAAIATPPGYGGIGVVRISGKDSAGILRALWGGKPPVSAFESHRLYYGPVKRRDVILDRVLVSVMRAPRSYTGEDVVEISGHGGPAVLAKILDACCDAGARMAEPGEFTKRAFLNGRMDLVQAEAVADIIASSSERGLKYAQDQLSGRLSEEIRDIQDGLTGLRAFVEASIDFPEEDVAFIERAGIKEGIETVTERAADLLKSFEGGRIIREGVRVVIAGLPNAGKSSILNALAGRERAIVHHQPGTTRDVIEETIVIDGIAIHLRDTAGLRDGGCEVERIGVARAEDEIDRADMVIYVIDSCAGKTVDDEKALKEMPRDKTVLVYNKSDLLVGKNIVGEKENGIVSVSALTGQGIEKIKETLLAEIKKSASVDPEGVVITNARHRDSLEKTVGALEQAAQSLDNGDAVEFTAHHLKTAQDDLGNITGETSTEDVLNRIFSSFCIGK